MKFYTYIFLTFNASGVLAMGGGAATRRGHGLPGYGIPVFQPPCAFACRDAISGATLNCSTAENMGGMAGMDIGGMVMTSPECYAMDDVFLETLALCVQSRCKDIPVWTLEQYWKDNVAGTYAVQPDPKETYQEALAKTKSTPTAVYAEMGSLNRTSIVAESLWYASYQTDVIFGHQESMQEGYG